MTFPLVPMVSGADLTADLLNDALSIERVVIATADQTVASSTVLVNSTYIFMSVAANAFYTLDMFLIYDAPAAGDFKYDWTVPAGGFFRKSQWASGTTAATTDATIFHQADDVLTGAAGGIAAGTYMTSRPVGVLATISAGTLQFRFAQVAASGSTILKAGSWMRLTRVG